MNITELINQVDKCETCERVRYPDKFCGECMFNQKLKNNYKIDRNVDNLLKAAGYAEQKESET